MSSHDSLFGSKDTHQPPAPTLLTLPPEIRTQIYTHLFSPPSSYAQAFPSTPHALDPSYTASKLLLPLLVCRQIHAEAHLLALSRTLFVVSDPDLALALGPRLSSRLPPASLAALRHVAFVADSRHFQALTSWGKWPFGQPLRLESLSVVLHRGSHWDYPYGHHAALVTLLRGLEGVERLVLVRNEALINGTLLMWHNLLALLILKTGREARLVGAEEQRGWEWEICQQDEVVSLSRKEAKRPGLSMEGYDELEPPLYTALMKSIERAWIERRRIRIG